VAKFEDEMAKRGSRHVHETASTNQLFKSFFFFVSHGYIDSCLVMSSSSVDISNTGLRRSSVLSTYSTSSVTTIQNERTPLVTKANDSLTSPTTYRKEVHWLFSNSLPIVVTYLLQTSLQMASVFSLGHIVS
jgi:hypothetical protein